MSNIVVGTSLSHFEAQQHKYRGTAPRYDAVLLSVTERCHVGCRHCGFLGAIRERESTLDEIVSWTIQVCEYGIDRVIFTGGEPFERLDVLEASVKAAGPFNRIVGVFTSSFWGTSVDNATSILQRLEGLSHLFLSTDAFHQERVPYSYVANVIDAAHKVKIPYITMCVTYSNPAELEEVKSHYQRWGDELKFHEDRVIPTQFLSKGVLQRQAAGVSACSSNYQTTCYLQTPLINPNGDLLACHSGKAAAHRDMRHSPYYLGNLRENSFSEIVNRASRRWDYQFLRTNGPRGVAGLTEGNFTILNEVGRREFTNGCDMCFSILRTNAGREALASRCKESDVRDAINARLALGLGEDPICDDNT